MDIDRIKTVDTTENTIVHEQKPPCFTKQVGGMRYTVEVHFSKTSKETMSDKILRLIQNEGTTCNF